MVRLTVSHPKRMNKANRISVSMKFEIVKTLFTTKMTIP
jgi:hypothetical protein